MPGNPPHLGLFRTSAELDAGEDADAVVLAGRQANNALGGTGHSNDSLCDRLHRNDLLLLNLYRDFAVLERGFQLLPTRLTAREPFTVPASLA